MRDWLDGMPPGGIGWKEAVELAGRLQLTEEIEISSDNFIFKGYTHVWKNAHWFNETGTLRPTSQDTRPTTKELDGAKRIQTSLIQYSLNLGTTTHQDVGYQDVELPRRQVSENLSLLSSSSLRTKLPTGPSQDDVAHVAVPALLDVCCRLLDATQCSTSGVPLQAVIETKQLLGFFSPTEVCLIKSPRILRRLLWKKKLKFGSLFGHSKSLDPSVNLPPEDFATLTDGRANFPGCVRWRSLLEQGGLSERSRRILDRVREFLIFRGKEEVVAFLHLLRTEIVESRNKGVAERAYQCYTYGSDDGSAAANCQSTSASVDDSAGYITKEDMPEGALDASCTRRVLANFPFRGASVCVPELLWNAAISPARWCVRFGCSLTPVAQSEILKGAIHLAGSASVQMRIVVSHSILDAWAPISCATVSSDAREFGLPMELVDKCPDIVSWIEEHIPRTTYITESEKPRLSLGNGGTIFALPAKEDSPQDRLAVSTTTALLRLPAAENSSSAGQGAVRPSGSCLAIVITTSEQNTERCKRPTNIPPNAQRISGMRRRVGPAPSLASQLKRLRTTRSGSCARARPLPLPEGENTREGEQHGSVSVDTLWSRLPSNFRRALVRINGDLVCFVGNFPFAPLIVSLPLSEVSTTHYSILHRVDFVVVSSSISTTELNFLRGIVVAEKLRTPLWFSQRTGPYHHKLSNESTFEKYRNEINAWSWSATTEETTFTIAPLKNDRTSPLFTQILPRCINDQSEKSSRNVFFWVPNLVLADLMSPLASDPLRHVLLSVSSPSLRARLWQLSEKQRQWEESAAQRLTQLPIDARFSMLSMLMERCPPFLVHLLCIVPIHIPLSENTDQPAQGQVSDHITTEHQRAVGQLQAEFPYRDARASLRSRLFPEMPIDSTEPSTKAPKPLISRLIVWYLPLNFLEEVYTMPQMTDLHKALYKHRLRDIGS